MPANEGGKTKIPGIHPQRREALVKLHRSVIDGDIINETLGCIFKYREDMEIFRQKFAGEQLADLGIPN